MGILSLRKFSSLTINSICVCGAGTMGSGIAQVAAQAGYYTILFDLDAVVLIKAKASILQGLQRLADKKLIAPGDVETIYSRIQFTGDLQSCLADVFIEAIVEKAEIKIGLFNQLAELNHSECIFASNTSSLSINVIAEKVKNPDRVIGMHFFNPAPLMKLVEVVNAKQTSADATNTICELARSMGKTPVVCKDSPGFIVNRVARPYYIESLRLLEEGHGEMAAIDSLMEASGFRMGPFRLMDLIGNDINYAVSCSVYDQLDKPERLRPSPIQEANVQSGKLGRKTGRGYYDYDTPNQV